MAAYEWVVVGYFLALIVGAWVAQVPMNRRLRASALGVCVLVVVQVTQAASPGLRAWLPHLYLVAGYWMPALLVPALPDSRFEEWLRRSDIGWRRSLPALPMWLTPLVELAYLLCYPLVPLALAIVWMYGGDGDVERFWFAVLLSGYCCYGTLPWLVSRPPRLHQAERKSRGSLAAINTGVLARVSHEFTTFPSGHVAVAAAAAVAVAMVSLPAGTMLGLLVAAIGVGAAAGHYHYVMDVLLGLATAGAAHVVAAAM